MSLWDKCGRCGKLKQAEKKTCPHCEKPIVVKLKVYVGTG